MNKERLLKLAGGLNENDYTAPRLSKNIIKDRHDLEEIKNRVEKMENQEGDVEAFKLDRNDYYALYDFVYNMLQ